MLSAEGSTGKQTNGKPEKKMMLSYGFPFLTLFSACHRPPPHACEAQPTWLPCTKQAAKLKCLPSPDIAHEPFPQAWQFCNAQQHEGNKTMSMPVWLLISRQCHGGCGPGSRPALRIMFLFTLLAILYDAKNPTSVLVSFKGLKRQWGPALSGQMSG